MNILQPIPGRPATADGVRPLTERELDFYTTMEAHYKQRCAAEPCNRVLKTQLRMYSHIVASKEVGTFVGQIPVP